LIIGAGAGGGSSKFWKGLRGEEFFNGLDDRDDTWGKLAGHDGFGDCNGASEFLKPMPDMDAVTLCITELSVSGGEVGCGFLLGGMSKMPY
jgi:hypothetical protein